MLILALDTSSAGGSAAIVRDGAVLLERSGDESRTHGERLPHELMTLLDEARIALTDVDRFAVAVGPGSFTGLRVGIATIQGLAAARRKLVTPVSTFEALAFAAPDTRPATSDTRSLAPDPRHPAPSAIAPWLDAHRGEVFATLLAPDGRTALAPPSALTPAATLAAWRPLLGPQPRVRFAGDGAVRYRQAIEAELGDRAAVDAATPALAAAIGLIAWNAPDRAVAPHAIMPVYVRRPDAELARERRQSAKP